MTKDQFTKLFQYLQSMESKFTVRFDQIDQRFIKIEGTIAEMLVDIRDIKHEMSFIVRDQIRHDRWIHQLADNADVELSVD